MSRFFVFGLVLVLTGVFTGLWLDGYQQWAWPLIILAPLSLLGLKDISQKRHAILRNYPLIGHLRFLFEGIRPELRQYFFSGDDEEMPFNRNQRSLVYQRAKQQEDNIPYGTEQDVYRERYAWLNHSMDPTHVSLEQCRVTIGNEQCLRPYHASVLNISAMSFGSLSAHAIEALNRGAAMGGFAHDTGEGGYSPYHRAGGGDIIWEIGTGYFGCRTKDGLFDPDLFKERANNDQIKMIEIKMSQGAKPGHGGILPAAKITPEIAETRAVPMGKDCVSPSNHTAFTTPLEMMDFIQELRHLSGGKPVGFKMCIGHRWEFMALVKAMIEKDTYPDFIVIDGAEGGTGAAPVEFSDHIGTPLTEGLHFAHQVLKGAGIRQHIKLGASGKIISAFDMIRMFSLGADYCNAARAFMMTLGCIQAQSCHTNKCPTGVATQDPLRQRALNIPDKSHRVANYHKSTLHALCDALSAAGIEGPAELQHNHIFVRDGDGIAQYIMSTRQRLDRAELLKGTDNPSFKRDWEIAQAASFRPSYTNAEMS